MAAAPNYMASFSNCAPAHFKSRTKTKMQKTSHVLKQFYFWQLKWTPSFIIERIHFHVVYSITSVISVKS